MSNQSWKHEVSYDILISTPEVKHLLHRHVSKAKLPIPAEALIKKGKFVVPAGKWLAKKAGMKTEKHITKNSSSPVGQAIIAVLCTLARNSISIQNIQQFQDGCVLEAIVPSDWRAGAGELVVSVRHTTKDSTSIEISIHFDQLFDWGKSKYYLDTISKDLDMALWEVN